LSVNLQFLKPPSTMVADRNSLSLPLAVGVAIIAIISEVRP